MKKFIDLRGQGTGTGFAWWCTVRDVFECYNGNYAWDTWGEFKEDYLAFHGRELSRYHSLCPSWAFCTDKY